MAEQIVRVIMEGAAAPAAAPATGTAIAAGSGKPPGWTDGLRRPGRSFADVSPVGTPINGNGAANGSAFTNRLWSVGRSFDQITNGLNRINQENGTALRNRLASVGKSFDPNVEALKIMERQARKQAVSEAYAQISPAGVPLGVRVGNYVPGMAPPPIQIKPSPIGSGAGAGSASAIGEGAGLAGVGQGLVRALGVVTIGLTALGKVLDLVNSHARTEISATASEVGSNDIVQARMARRQQSMSEIKGVTTIGGGVAGAAAGAAIGTAIFPGIGTLIGAGIGAGVGAGLGAGAGKVITQGEEKRQTADQNLLVSGNALQERFARLGRYGGQIGGALATQQVQQMRQDIGEANAIGPQAAQVIGAQTENNRLRQILGSIKAVGDMDAQQGRLAVENQKLRKEIAELSKHVKGANEIANKINRGGETAVDKILGGHMQMPTDHPHAAVNRRLQDQINIPLIIPAFAEGY